MVLSFALLLTLPLLLHATGCGDGHCTPSVPEFENCFNCPQDCGCADGLYCPIFHGLVTGSGCIGCGDGVFQNWGNIYSENCLSCPEDASCGEGFTCLSTTIGPLIGECIQDWRAVCGDGSCLGDFGFSHEGCACPEDCLGWPNRHCDSLGVAFWCDYDGSCGDFNEGGFTRSEWKSPNARRCSDCKDRFGYTYDDGICNWEEGETCASQDCPCPGQSVCLPGTFAGRCSGCGNGECESGENCVTCPADCACGLDSECTAFGTCQQCGNGQCDPYTENCLTCPEDCGCSTGRQCVDGGCIICDPPCCGNRQCDLHDGESAAGCSRDCYIGDGVCHAGDGENCQNAPDDCGCLDHLSCYADGICGDPCGDSSCEIHRGENCSTCPLDCTCPQEQSCYTDGSCGPPCGDGVCDDSRDEDCNTCSDCECSADQSCYASGICADPCGDETCSADEDCNNCPTDCGCTPEESCYPDGSCGNPCGDSFCDSSRDENCQSCPTDCQCLSNESCYADGSCGLPCGDTICELGRGEDCNTCPSDCACPAEESCYASGVCGDPCGDGLCESSRGENCYICEDDCACEESFICRSKTWDCVPTCLCDICPGMADKTSDRDGDGAPDCMDECPDDPTEVLEPPCGCNDACRTDKYCTWIFSPWTWNQNENMWKGGYVFILPWCGRVT